MQANNTLQQLCSTKAGRAVIRQQLNAALADSPFDLRSMWIHRNGTVSVGTRDIRTPIGSVATLLRPSAEHSTEQPVAAFMRLVRQREAMPVPYMPLDNDAPDFRDVHGQEIAKRALEIALVGGLSVSLAGPGDCGKSMLSAAANGIRFVAVREHRAIHAETDIQVDCTATGTKDMAGAGDGETTAVIAKRVEAARHALDRLLPSLANDALPEIARRVATLIDGPAERLLDQAVAAMNLTTERRARALHVAAAIAAMAGSESHIGRIHVAEALSYIRFTPDGPVDVAPADTGGNKPSPRQARAARKTNARFAELGNMQRDRTKAVVPDQPLSDYYDNAKRVMIDGVPCRVPNPIPTYRVPQPQASAEAEQYYATGHKVMIAGVPCRLARKPGKVARASLIDQSREWSGLPVRRDTGTAALLEDVRQSGTKTLPKQVHATA